MAKEEQKLGEGSSQNSNSQFPEIITVLPGDDVTEIINNLVHSSKKSSNTKTNTSKERTTKLGNGLRLIEQDENENNTIKKYIFTATLAGRLQHRITSKAITFHILANTKRYFPQRNDRIVATIDERIGDYYRVTIPHASTGSALLPITAFEGATKRNRPMLNHGDLVYCRIDSETEQSRVMEPFVSCCVRPGEISSGGGGLSKKDWMTDEGTYGQLKGGCTASISLGLAQELLLPHNVVLDALGRSSIPFEICIGVNGMIWVKTKEDQPEYTILILNAIENSQVMTEAQVRGMVKALVKTVRSGIDSQD